MNENHQIPRLTRLTAILTLLQSKRLMTATEIADKFGISKRTAYRDIKALEESGVPIFTEEGKGYSLLEGYYLPPIMFTEHEANALITASALIQKNKDQSLIDNHSTAISKIRAVLRYSNKDKATYLSERIAYFKNYKREITSDNLAIIQIAITNLQLLKINYLSIGKSEKTQRTIEPQAIYHSKENWILIAWCHLRNDYREFRLDKIISIQQLTEQFSDRGFNLYAYFQEVMLRYQKEVTRKN
ncbi:MAG TPA: YafY family transcriptional regulator [Lutibacter sp.]|nr:YafY family transcriptional regulator [Lutibacter sp.]